MKHIYTLLLGLLAWSASMAQEGVNFRDITFEEALKQAKSENKLVFMDCYTSWCGPCKNMADKVFPQKAAGDYFNPRPRACSPDAGRWRPPAASPCYRCGSRPRACR